MAQSLLATIESKEREREREREKRNLFRGWDDLGIIIIIIIMWVITGVN
jgi:hypothetical protein